MTVSARVQIEHPDLGLAQTIQSVPDAEIGVIPDAGTDPKHDGYFFWIDAPEFESVEAALEADHTVAEFSRISTAGERKVYRITYSEDTKLVSPVILRVGGLMLETQSTSRGWEIHLQLPDHGTLDQLAEYAAAEDITVTVLEIQQVAADTERKSFDLTEPQIEALVSAYEHGYYDEPRNTSLEELGNMLGVGKSSVSGRIRRGSEQLIEQTLCEKPPEKR